MLLGTHIHTSLVYTVTTTSNFTPTKEQMGQKLPNDSRQCFYWSFKARSVNPFLFPYWLQMILRSIYYSELYNALLYITSQKLRRNFIENIIIVWYYFYLFTYICLSSGMICNHQEIFTRYSRVIIEWLPVSVNN